MGVKLNIQEFIKDYCCGLKDKALLAKHNISPKEFVGVVRKLIGEGLITKEQYFERNRKIQELEAQEEKEFLKSLYHCPVCGHIHPTPFEVCPACGTELKSLGDVAATKAGTSTAQPQVASVTGADFEQTTESPGGGKAGVVAPASPAEPVPDYLLDKLDMAVEHIQTLAELGQDLSEGDYALVEILAHGGWSVVYKAEDFSGNLPPVAVKRFHPELVENSDQLRTFLSKVVYYQSGMQDPNIVRLLGTGEVDGEPVVLYEFISSDFQKMLQSAPDGFSYDFFLAILPQILNAVGYCHLHRASDGSVRRLPHLHLRPSKFLYDETTGMVKLDDAGVWRSLVETRGHKRKLWEEPEADPATLGPECFVQDSKFVNGFYADIYALGVLLYKLITGKAPFIAEDTESYRFVHLHTFPIPPRVHKYQIPGWLDKMILKCLEKEPQERWRSATQMELSIGKDYVPPQEIARPATAERLEKSRPPESRPGGPWRSIKPS